METEEIRKLAETKYKEIENKYGLSVYGSRTHANKKMVFARGKLAEHDNLTPKENRFGYPPPEYCKKLGRANYPEHPVLYAGESPEVIGGELSLKKDDWLHLAIFHTPEPISFEYLLLLHDEISIQNKWHKILHEFKHFMIKNHPEKHLETPEQVWERIQSAAKAFRNHNYEETAAIAFHWLYIRNIDAILYPSLRSDDYCNFALNTNFVDKNLHLYRVHACKWLGENLELHQTGELESGTIVWRQTNKDDVDEFQSGYANLQS